VRIGSIMSTIMVFTGARLGWSTATFAAINTGLALCWLAFVILVGREHRRRSTETPAQIADEPSAPHAIAPGPLAPVAR
jgi:hypothetical protein